MEQSPSGDSLKKRGDPFGIVKTRRAVRDVVRMWGPSYEVIDLGKVLVPRHPWGNPKGTVEKDSLERR